LNCNVLREKEAELAIRREAAEYLARPDALFCLAPTNAVRQTVHKITSSKCLDGIVIPVILISCVLMALDVPGKEPPAWMETWDRVALAIFTVEMFLKIIDLGLIRAPEAYLRDGWNFLDCFIVLMGFLDIALSAVLTGNSSLAGLKAMRLLRTLRPLRLISRAEGVKECFNCLVTSIPAGGQASVLLTVGALAFAVVGVMQFGGRFHICADSQLWTAAIITSWTRTNDTGTETILVRDWLDCVGGAGMAWYRPPMAFDDVSVSMKTLFESATFSGYSDSLVPAIMGKGPGLQPAWEVNEAVSVPACAFFFLWLVFGGLVVRRNVPIMLQCGLCCRGGRVWSCSQAWSLTLSRHLKLKAASPRGQHLHSCSICGPCMHRLNPWPDPQPVPEKEEQMSYTRDRENRNKELEPAAADLPAVFIFRVRWVRSALLNVLSRHAPTSPVGIKALELRLQCSPFVRLA